MNKNEYPSINGLCLQILEAVERSKASHRLSVPPPPDAGQEFRDYMRSNYESRDKQRVKDIKRFIGIRKKVKMQEEKVLEAEKQPK